jgi:hypothetical protein
MFTRDNGVTVSAVYGTGIEICSLGIMMYLECCRGHWDRDMFTRDNDVTLSAL